MRSRRHVGVAVAAWLVAALTVVPAIAAVTSQGGGVRPGGDPAAPLAISLEPGTTTRVSVNDDGSQFVRIVSDEVAVSPDGQWATYRATPVGVQTPTSAVLLADRRAGTTTQIFPTTAGPTIGTSDGPVGPLLVEEPTVSADGSLVAFGLTSGTQTPTIMLWRRGSGLSFPLSGALTGNVPGLAGLSLSALHHPRLSADGSTLAFQSDGYAPLSTVAVIPALPAGVYTLQLATGLVDVVSARTSSTVPAPAKGQFGSLAISADGRVVAFASGQGLSPTTAFARVVLPTQIWLRDRAALTTTLVSAAKELASAGPSDHPALSSDGTVVAFESDAPDLVPGDANGTTDVFSWTAQSGVVRVSVAPDGTEANDSSAWPAVSADGRSIAFASRATNLVPGDTNALPFSQTDRATPYDIFVAGPQADRLARVSVGLGPAEADDTSLRPAFALNDRLVFFESSATNLVPGDTNGNSDIFVRDRRPPQPPPSPSPSPSPTPTPTPTPTPVIKPAIIVSPDPVDFGSVPIGTLGVTGSATVLSVGTGPAQVGAVAISGQDASDFLLSANACTGTSLAPGSSCALGLLFVGTATGTRTALLSVSSNAGPPEVVKLIAAVGVGILRLDPESGPSGTVTIATGTGFPANAPVILTWSVGVTPTPLQPIFTDTNGGFTAQVLVLPRDLEGRRTLRAVATLSGVPAPPATAPFLVVAGTGAPPVSGLIQVFRDSLGQPIILRR